MTMRTRPAGDFDYETHGRSYAAHRLPDPSIEARIHAALGDAATVLNVGAGAGSYEPADRYVVAVEPSAAMRAQRPAGRPAIDADAGRLPFDDDAFDAAMGVYTVHHWPDQDAGLAELRRVMRGPVVLMTQDPDRYDEFWLCAEYVPGLGAAERSRFGPIDAVAAALGPATRIEPVPVPLGCTDGFVEAFYGRPEAFLDPAVRANQSSWGHVDRAAQEDGFARLAADLASGAWDARHGALRTQPALHGALRLVVSPS